MGKVVQSRNSTRIYVTGGIERDEMAVEESECGTVKEDMAGHREEVLVVQKYGRQCYKAGTWRNGGETTAVHSKMGNGEERKSGRGKVEWGCIVQCRGMGRKGKEGKGSNHENSGCVVLVWRHS